jgi:hypothetical protein
MAQEEKILQANEVAQKSFAFLSSVRKGQDLTVRDDLLDFQLLLDAVKLSRRKGVSFRIVDSGTQDVIQMEWLAAEGATVYTSDDAARNPDALYRINTACKRGNSFLAYLHNGSLSQEADSLDSGWPHLARLGAEGVYIHLSNRENERDVVQLTLLADQCTRGGGWLVYYHHGELSSPLVELARNGAWIHLTDRCLYEEKEHSLLLEIIGATRSAGSNCLLHLERELDYYSLKDIQKTGAIMLFKSKLIDYRSPLVPILNQAAHTKLDARTYYLYSKFFY